MCLKVEFIAASCCCAFPAVNYVDRKLTVQSYNIQTCHTCTIPTHTFTNTHITHTHTHTHMHTHTSNKPLVILSHNDALPYKYWCTPIGSSHALLRFCFVLIGVSGDPQTNVQISDSVGLEYRMERWNGKWKG